MRISRTEGAHSCAHLFSIMRFVYSRIMTWPVVSSVVIRARTFSHNGPEADVVREVFRSRVETSPSFSIFKHYPAISTSRLHSWMCVRARVLTHPCEDQMLTIPANAFLAPEPCVVDPSAEPRGHGSTLDAVPLRFLLGIVSRARCSVGRIAQRR